MPKTIGILQSNYIPWKGYFDIIRMVDEFVLFDDAHFTKGEWRNRNKIKTKDGLKWLTIPVEHKVRFPKKIRDTRISDLNWPVKHWDLIRDSYSRSEFFKDYQELFEDLYLTCDEKYLSQVNYRFLTAVNKVLDIKTPLSWSYDFKLVEGRNERLLSICQQARASRLLLGPAAKVYLDETLFGQAGMEVEWMDYSGYPEYRQLFPPFEHAVTILDLIFNEGPNAKHFMKKL